MAIFASGITDIGTRRTINQDAFIYKTAIIEGDYFGLYAVADGVGGLSMGEYASKIAIQRIQEWWEHELSKNYGKIENMISSMVKKLELINRDITLYCHKEKCNMATTLTMLLIYKDMFYVINIGDSRVYRIVNRKVSQVTTDQKAIDKKTNRMALTEYLGGKRTEFNYAITSGIMKTNEYFALGSDGIFNRLNPIDIKNAIYEVEINNETLETACVNLVTKVKKRSETDNITLILVNVNKKIR